MVFHRGKFFVTRSRHFELQFSTIFKLGESEMLSRKLFWRVTKSDCGNFFIWLPWFIFHQSFFCWSSLPFQSRFICWWLKWACQNRAKSTSIQCFCYHQYESRAMTCHRSHQNRPRVITSYFSTTAANEDNPHTKGDTKKIQIRPSKSFKSP